MKPAAAIGTPWWPRLLALLVVPSLAASGCVKQSQHDALRRSQSRAQLADCRRNVKLRDAMLQQAKAAQIRVGDQLVRSQQERTQLAAELATLRLATAQSAVREAQHEEQIRRLSQLVEQHATTFPLTALRLRSGGTLLGLRKGGSIGKKLRAHLVTSGMNHLQLGKSARVDVDGVPFHEMTVEVEAAKVRSFTLSASQSGRDAVPRLRRLTERLCAATGHDFWHHSRPGPGTPKPDPFTGKVTPLVTLSKASCDFEARPWHVTVHAVHAHDGANLNRVDIEVRLGSKHD